MAEYNFNFDKITFEEMYNYIDTECPDKHEWFAEVALETRHKKIGEKVFDKNGNPVMFQVKNKDGSLKYDENGNPIMRQKTRMIETAEVDEVYNHLKAKRNFFKMFFPNLLPKEGTKDETPKAVDILRKHKKK